MHIESLWRYPIKGMSGESLDATMLTPGKPINGDRRYAISVGSTQVANSPAGTWLKKSHFLQLMSHEALATLTCSIAGDHLTIAKDGAVLLRANLLDADGTAAVEAFFTSFMNKHQPGQLRGAPRLVHLDDRAFTDTDAPWISLGGSASIEAYAAATDTAPDARRFRLNMIIKTDDAFSEASLIGKDILVGEAQLRVVAPIGRCAAINVDPKTAYRGMDTLPIMRGQFGHTNLGIFAELITPGLVKTDDHITVL